MAQIVHGLLQKALIDANELHQRLTVSDTGSIWIRGPNEWQWRMVGQIDDSQLAEDFLTSQLSQEDR